MKTISLAVLLNTMLTAAAWAQMCGPRAMVVQMLKERHGEDILFSGTNSAVRVDWLANTKTKTWTLLSTTPQGWSCMRAAGYDFRVEKLLLGKLLGEKG